MPHWVYGRSGGHDLPADLLSDSRSSSLTAFLAPKMRSSKSASPGRNGSAQIDGPGMIDRELFEQKLKEWQ
jgi:hypothetical protein